MGLLTVSSANSEVVPDGVDWGEMRPERALSYWYVSHHMVFVGSKPNTNVAAVFIGCSLLAI